MRMIFRAWQPRASSQANKHIEAGVTMERSISRPRSHPRRSITATQPQNTSGREEPVERCAAAPLLSLEETDSLFSLSLCN
jgi:hypothetical protein